MSSQDLEKIVGQLQDSPGHILGLNGWILRTLPKDKRETFLKGFEKLIRVAYFPDHASSPRDKTSRERYIQAVSNAVSFLTSNEFAYELGTETVPTEKNPIIQLKTDMEQQVRDYEGQVSSLNKKIETANSEIRSFQRVNHELTTFNSIELERISILLRLQDHNRFYLSQNRCYNMRSKSPFSISGYFLDFSRREGIDSLQSAVFRYMHGLETAYEHFQQVLERNFLAGKKETFRFKKGTVKNGDYILKLRGGLTIASIREFIAYKNLLSSLDGEFKGGSLDKFRQDMCELPNTTLSVMRKGFKNELDLSYFSLPILNIGLPVLIKETLKIPKEHFPQEKRCLPQEKSSLFYVTGINPYS